MFTFKLKHQKIIFAILTVTLIIYFLYHNKYVQKTDKKVKSLLEDTNACDFKKVEYVTATLCDLYLNKKQVIGSLCDALCAGKTLTLKSCYNTENKVVLVFRDEQANLDVVLKSKHKHFYDFNQFTYDLESYKTSGDLEQFLYTYVNSTLKHNFNTVFVDYKEYLRLIQNFIDVNQYGKYYGDVSEGSLEDKRIFILNFLTLIQQDEYLFYKVFQNKPNILNIYGTCGHFYAIEKADSLYRTFRRKPQTELMQIASKFLDLIDNFNSALMLQTFHQNTTMEICDVKLENFGLNSKNELMLIDTDMVYLQSNVFNGEVCRTHEDCHFFDCKSYCDPKTNHCGRTRVNNNLQIICEKIFTNQLFENDSLLNRVTFEEPKEFNKTIEMCRTPGFVNGTNVKIGADLSLVKVFRRHFNGNQTSINGQIPIHLPIQH